VKPVKSNCRPAALAAIAQGLKTIIMLAYYFPPDNISGARRPFRFAKYLPAAGYAVNVISAAPALEGCDNVHTAPAAHRRYATRMVSAALLALQTHLLPYNDRLPWIADAVSVAGATLARSPACAVLSTSPPISTHLAALCIKQRFGLPWVADFRDPLYGNPFRSRKFAWMYDSSLERLLLSQADAVIANTDAAAEVLQRRYPRWRSKVQVLWNGYDPEESVGPRPIPDRRHHVMTHAGSIYGGRRPGALLKALAYLIDAGRLKPDQFRLQLIGPLESDASWVRQSPFERLAAAGCLTYTGTAVPEVGAREAMSVSDSLLLLDTNSLNSGLQLPAKIFDYIRIGRPILAFTTKNSPTERVLEDSGIRYVAAYPDDSAERVAAKTLDCIQLPSQALTPSDWFCNTFAAPAQAATLASILNRVAG
jgi:glycosyltransferase involved in cell wall biosynthesis